MIRHIQSYFFRYGWLLPAWFPLMLLFGRAPQNIFLGLYSCWGCIALYKNGYALEKKWLWLWCGVLIALGFSIIFAEHPQLVFRKWLQIASHLLVFLLVLVTISSSNSPDKKMHQFLCFLGMGGMLSLLGLYFKFFLSFQKSDFQPTIDMLEDYLPLLMPFMLYQMHHLPFVQWFKNILSVVLVSMVSFYVVYSDGRAAILGLCLVGLNYGCLVLKLRFTQVSLVLVLVLSTMLFFNLNNLTRGAWNQPQWENKLSTFTSGRSELWMDAVHHPPPSLLFGVGIGHLKSVPDIAVLKSGEKVRDFHNFILNIWYETGFIGLTAWLSFIFWPIMRVVRAWQKLNKILQEKAGVFLSASIAILSAGLLTPSHFSVPFTFYLPIVLAGLILCKPSILLREVYN